MATNKGKTLPATGGRIPSGRRSGDIVPVPAASSSHDGPGEGCAAGPDPERTTASGGAGVKGRRSSDGSSSGSGKSSSKKKKMTTMMEDFKDEKERNRQKEKERRRKNTMRRWDETTEEMEKRVEQERKMEKKMEKRIEKEGKMVERGRSEEKMEVVAISSSEEEELLEEEEEGEQRYLSKMKMIDIMGAEEGYKIWTSEYGGSITYEECVEWGRVFLAKAQAQVEAGGEEYTLEALQNIRHVVEMFEAVRYRHKHRDQITREVGTQVMVKEPPTKKRTSVSVGTQQEAGAPVDASTQTPGYLEERPGRREAARRAEEEPVGRGPPPPSWASVVGRRGRGGGVGAPPPRGTGGRAAGAYAPATRRREGTGGAGGRRHGVDVAAEPVRAGAGAAGPGRVMVLPDAVAISSAKEGISPLDLFRRARGEIDPQKMGVRVGGVRETRGGQLLVTLLPGDRDGAPRLLDALRGAVGGEGSVKLLTHRIPVEVLGLDGAVTAEEVVTALQGIPGGVPPGEIKVEGLRPFFRGTQIARVTLPAAAAARALRAGRVSLKWGEARLRRVNEALKCYRCLELGHLARFCRSAVDRSRCCWRCLRPGHTKKECPGCDSGPDGDPRAAKGAEVSRPVPAPRTDADIMDVDVPAAGDSGRDRVS